jgi:hypothetical protein
MGASADRMAGGSGSIERFQHHSPQFLIGSGR